MLTTVQQMKPNKFAIKRLSDLCVDNHFDLQQMVNEAAKVPDSDRVRMCVPQYIHISLR